MANLNKALMIGNLTRDPELRYTSGGSPVCNFSIAVNRYYNDKSGDRKEETTFLRVTVWGKQGEHCAQYLAKGRSVFVEGRLQSRSWETEDGQKRSSIDLVAENVQFLTGKSGSGGRDGDMDMPPPPPAEDDIPF